MSEALRLADALDALMDEESLVGAVTIDRAAAELRRLHAALAEPEQPVAINWTLNGDKRCGYDNWVGETPFGRILITWKSWKDFPEACVDEFPGGFEAYGDPDDVKDECEAEFRRRFGAAPTPQPEQERPHPDYPCRSDGRCQYAIDSGAEGLGHCPPGKCCMAARLEPTAQEIQNAAENLALMKRMFPQPEQEPVARAWQEGYNQGIEDERISEANIGICGFGAKVEPARQNPYKTTAPAPSKPEQEPVKGVVIREGLPTLLSESGIKSTDVRLYTAPTPQREHITDGSPCWCNPDVIEEDGGNVIVHNYEDNWQQYAKPGETAQQCIERHRSEQDALMKLYATPRKPLTELEMPTLFVGGLALNSEATTEVVRAVEKAHGIGEQT